MEEQKGWKLIAASNFPSELTPRTCPVVSQLNVCEILIMGGNDGDGFTKDVFVMDIENDRIKKVAVRSPIKFHGTYMAGVMV